MWPCELLLIGCSHVTIFPEAIELTRITSASVSAWSSLLAEDAERKVFAPSMVVDAESPHFWSKTPEKRRSRKVGICPIRLAGHIPISVLIRTWRQSVVTR